jgi:hypothetical protein
MFALLHDMLDREDLVKLLPMPAFDGTPGGGSTLPEGIWNERAANDQDFSDNELSQIYGAKKRKPRRKTKRNITTS